MAALKPKLRGFGRIETRLAILALLPFIALVYWGAETLAFRSAMEDGRSLLADRLQIVRRAVETEVDRFRALSAIVAQDPRIAQALTAGTAEARSRADAYLKTVGDLAGAEQVYLMDTTGLTVSGSRAGEPESFIGGRYDFRPYFLKAMAFGEGRYYGVGVTTGKPGYFVASRVEKDGRILGVVATKVDMSPLETTWARAGQAVGVADGEGVVFLTGLPQWRYRFLFPPRDGTGQILGRERRYAGTDVLERPPLLGSQARPLDRPAMPDLPAFSADAATDLLFAFSRSAIDDWQLFATLPLSGPRGFAQLVAVASVLCALLLLVGAIVVKQRRSMIAMKLRETRVLEERVAERTRDLASEVEMRRRTEAELRATHDSLIHSERLAALGRMSAAIVHEIGQPLSALESRLATVDHYGRQSGREEIVRNVSSMRDLLGRMRRTMHHLRSFAGRRDGRDTADVDLNEALDAALVIAAPRAREAGVRLLSELPSGLPLTRGVAVRLEQVFINLIVNGIDATRQAAGAQITIRSDISDGFVTIHVDDEGCGIDEAVQERLGEPFFTTKITGEGLGLGLAISNTILEDHGGALTFSSRDGGGTRASVRLPVVAGAVTPHLESA
ncbi:sensor histidine kinase [Fulvimarina endophytica]|nr:ATP-binding protein [Fulvimarina endophytica]